MKALCITGADNTTLAAIAAPFYKAGMKQPQTLAREQSIDFKRWHQQVASTLASKQPIGKLWENLASDLLLANLNSDLWGWYEEQSVQALNFWADLEPNIHFLLVCTRPEDELCQKLSQASGADAIDAEALVKDWYQRHQSLLQFYLQHPQRCLLIDAQDALQHLNKQLLLAHDHWQLPLDHENAQAQPTEQDLQTQQEQPATLVALIAREALKNTQLDIESLYREVRAAQYPLTGLEESEATTRKLFDWLKQGIDFTTLNQLLQEHQSLQQQVVLAKQLPLLQDQSQNHQQQLDDLKQENEILLLQLHQVQEELESTFLSKQQLEKVQLEQKADPKLQEQLKEQQQENELLLLQLHQVQEELERYFLEHQKLSQEQQAISQQNRQLQRQLKQQEAINEQLNKSWLSRWIKPQKPAPMLEYDEVELRHEQVNKDYEHLWINLKNPVFGDDSANQWSFRLSCAAVKPGSFGQQPKLELPQQNEQLLHQWFEESTSDQGPKLELRFALPNSMDKGVWQQINPHDQKLIQSLIKQLPSILKDLKQKGVNISRNWTEWEKLAVDMNRIHQAKAD